MNINDKISVGNCQLNITLYVYIYIHIAIAMQYAHIQHKHIENCV